MDIVTNSKSGTGLQPQQPIVQPLHVSRVSKAMGATEGPGRNMSQVHLGDRVPKVARDCSHSSPLYSHCMFLVVPRPWERVKSRSHS